MQSTIHFTVSPAGIKFKRKTEHPSKGCPVKRMIYRTNPPWIFSILYRKNLTYDPPSVPGLPSSSE